MKLKKKGVKERLVKKKVFERKAKKGGCHR
jgi:hypothetical protein